jgi:hypothetical protein
VLKAEKALLGQGVPIDIIPTPKDISSECGMSIRIDGEKLLADKVIAVLNATGLRFTMYQRD